MPITIPIKVSETDIDLFIALDEQSIERIRVYDPVEVQSEKLTGFEDMRIRNIGIGYANEADIEHLSKLAKAGQIEEMMRFLSRGFAFRPELGDHDEKYSSLTKQS